MATVVESALSHEHAEPAVLREGDEKILPTQKLSGVDFGADTNSKQDNHSTLEDGHSQTQGESSSDKATAVKTPLKVDTNTQNGGQRSSRPAFKSQQTAPAMDSRRPQPLPQRSTFVRTIRRQPNDNQEPHPVASSSDSDLDSSDDEPAKPAQRPAQPQRALTQAEKVEQRQEQRHKQDHKQYSRLNMGNEHFQTKGRVSQRDGRLKISMNETANNGYFARALGNTINNHLKQPTGPGNATNDNSTNSSMYRGIGRPRLNIVIIVIGSRGDVQPFLRIGKILHDKHGHRVRIATHPTFREFVENEAGLEFFSIGGDPSQLMAFMVNNPGLIPSLQTIREGEVQRRRSAMGEMFDGMWRACTYAVEDTKDILNMKMAGDKLPFVADAIIANPVSMGHVHIAERLGVPLHVMFTMPYTPTQAFPHPVANIRNDKSNVDESYVNFMSYPLVEMMTWQGLGDIINKFRVQTLGLEPVSQLWAPGAMYRMKVPYTYMWSPSLIPKPKDWGPEINISGFVFLEQANTFKPPKELKAFLDAGEPPVYIGFGSIVVDDPDGFTKLILEAAKKAGVRALVNKGWGGFGASNENTPENIFMLEQTPHDWLFPRCKAVIHHGGAGTTAMGLKCAKPTMIVPFFGDQPFWGQRVVEAKAGASFCVPWKKLTAEKFAEGIKQCLTEEAQQNVQKLSDGMAKEGDGADNAVKFFHSSLPLSGKANMRCSILEDRVAHWKIKGSSLRLSSLAAEILLERKKIKHSDLKLFRVYPYNDFSGAGEPLTGTLGAITDSLYGIGTGVGMVPVRAAKHMRKRAEHEHKKAASQKRKEQREKQKGLTGLDKDYESQTTDERPANARTETTNTLGSALSADPSTPLAMELARDLGTGVKKSGAALLTMPNDLGFAFAQGMHNAPRLWGDSTVRKPIRVTGMKTGLIAARKEFSYGIYDAWTGLVTQPVNGYKEGDTVATKMAGLGAGVGKGLGGFVLKNVSAVVAPPAYTSKGVVAYIKKRSEGRGVGSHAYIRRAHFIQGQKDMLALREKDGPEQSKQTEKSVLHGYQVYQDVWHAAHHDLGVNATGKFKFHREKKRWQDAGALENIRVTEKALEIYKSGGSIEKYFAEHSADIKSSPSHAVVGQPGQQDQGRGITFADDLPEKSKESGESEEKTSDADEDYFATTHEDGVKDGRSSKALDKFNSNGHALGRVTTA